MLDRLLDQATRAMGALMVGCLALMVVLVFGNVVLRYVFNSGFTLSEELSRWLFVWMTFLGAVVALRERAHLGTDTLISRLPLAGRKICLGISQLTVLAICGLVLSGAWTQMRINWGSTSAVMQVSMGLLYASGVVFALAGSVMVLADFARLVSGRMRNDELAGPPGSEEAAPHGR